MATLRSKKRKAGGMRLSREMLLPLSRSEVRRISLKSHMALFNLHRGDGSFELAGDLLLMVLLSYIISLSEGTQDSLAEYSSAEAVLRSLIETAEEEGVWRIAPEQCPAIERVLSIYDVQLSSTPRHLYERATRTLLSRFSPPKIPRLVELRGLKLVPRS